jgi:hypothetical protein
MTDLLYVCVDCLMLIANGEANPDWSEAERDAHVARMTDRWPNTTLAYIGDESSDHDFSWNGCDACGSRLGGSRHLVTTI